MTRDETKNILRIIKDTYPSFKPDDMAEAITVWSKIFEEDDYRVIETGLYAYIRTDKSGFAPSPGQIISAIQKVQPEKMSEGEAWSLVSKAIRNSNYNSVDEFQKLPQSLQRAVGSPEQLKAWGMEADLNLEVVQSQVLRSYRITTEREKDIQKINPKVLDMIQDTVKMIGTNL